MSPRRKAAQFVKSSDTKASASQSKGEIERMLKRYGAVGFSVSTQYEEHGCATKIMCEFVVPDSPDQANAGKVPVRLPIDVMRMANILYGVPKAGYWHGEERLQRAERVAWRNLVLWIDAALSAATAGLQTITEAFLAHTLVVTENGNTTRMADYLEERQGVLAPGVRALLTSRAEVDR